MSESTPTTPTCPSCESPLGLGGTFCKRCGWDEALVKTDDAYLSGVDLPQGYAEEDPYEPPAPPHRAGRKEWLVVAAIFGGLIAASVLYAKFSK